MTNLETLLQNLETARNRCSEIPFKKFPITVIIENNAEQTEMINSYINLGLRIHTKLLQLIEIIRVQKEALDLIEMRREGFEEDLVRCPQMASECKANVEEIAKEAK